MPYTSNSEKQSRVYIIRNVLCILNVLNESGYSHHSLPDRFNAISDLVTWHDNWGVELTSAPSREHIMYYMPINKYLSRHNIDFDAPTRIVINNLIKEMKGLKDELKNRAV